MAPGRTRSGAAASARVDQPRPSSSWSLRSAMRSRSSMGVTSDRSVLMVRVEPTAMLTGFEGLHAPVEIIEGDGEVPRVATCRLEPEPGGSQIAGTYEGEDLEAHQRDLLGVLIHGGVASSEHRDAVLAVDQVIAKGVRPHDVGVEV